MRYTPKVAGETQRMKFANNFGACFCSLWTIRMKMTVAIITGMIGEAPGPAVRILAL
jgi:hypothetical protein